jgi:hypothetical protein
MAREKYFVQADPEPMCATVRFSDCCREEKMSFDTIGLLFIAVAFGSVPIVPFIGPFLPIHCTRAATIPSAPGIAFAPAAPPQLFQARTELKVPQIGDCEPETGPADKAFQVQDKRRVKRSSPSFWSKDADRAFGQVKIGPWASQSG